MIYSFGIFLILAASIKNKTKSVLLKDSNKISYYPYSFIPKSTADFSHTIIYLISDRLINLITENFFSLS